MTLPTHLNHPQLGLVLITYRTNSCKISARWKNGRVHINAPAHISADELKHAIDTLAPRLEVKQPTLTYRDSQCIKLDGVEFVITRQNLSPDKVTARPTLPTISIGVGSNFDFNSHETTQTISRLMCRVANRIAPQLLLPHARALADALNLKVASWSISTGHTTLGRCSANKEIALSYMLVFLPQHLRDYIVWHELAHLSEMNHSQRFHQLCNQYCNGLEKQYINELKHYHWPVLK